MDSNIQIAKNLLDNKTCNSCKYKEYEQGEVYYCSLNRQLDSNPYLGTAPLPEVNTCEHWEEASNVIFGHFISTTKELNDAMKKDISKWKKML